MQSFVDSAYLKGSGNIADSLKGWQFSWFEDNFRVLDLVLRIFGSELNEGFHWRWPRVPDVSEGKENDCYYKIL